MTNSVAEWFIVGCSVVAVVATCVQASMAIVLLRLTRSDTSSLVRIGKQVKILSDDTEKYWQEIGPQVTGTFRSAAALVATAEQQVSSGKQDIEQLIATLERLRSRVTGFRLMPPVHLRERPRVKIEGD